LVSIWLLGSKARGEAPGPESDVDLLVLVRDADWRRRGEIQVVAWEAVDATGANEGRFSVLVDTPEWLRGRREIRSFFIQRPQVAVVHHDHLVGGAGVLLRERPRGNRQVAGPPSGGGYD